MNNPDNRVKLTGILGGTFDPVHCGHLMIAEQVKDIYGLDEVLFIPAGDPPHKKGLKITEGFRRMDMLKLAIEANPYFKVMDIEVDKKGLTYTIDTLHILHELYGNVKKFFFIIGADVVFDLLTWKQYDDVFKKCDFIAVSRNGFSDEKVKDSIIYLKEHHGANIHFLNCPAFEVSSTFIRKSIFKGKSIKYLVPHIVEEYITKNNLYKDDSNCR